MARRLSEPQLVLASHNAGKLVELRELLAGQAIEAVSAAALGLPEPVEDGTTFAANARIKAHAVAGATGLPALADDSGIEVDALYGAPGVHSARFAGADAGDDANNALLVEKMRGVPAERRGARYRAVIVLMCHAADPSPLICEGSWEGIIQLEPRGEGGFGYDPIFVVPELDATFAEISREDKSARSHRGRAVRQMVDFLRSWEPA